jgi:hypothetical protein
MKFALTILIASALCFSACGSKGESAAKQACACLETAKAEPAKAVECVKLQAELQKEILGDKDEIQKYLAEIAKCTGG